MSDINSANKKRSCNLHDDCDEADKTIMEIKGKKAFHCTDPDCKVCKTAKCTIE